ncbi:primosomal protein [Cellulomonas palmilytica]|uniref:primosomal protein n=1 Tax=Cellulomonas palmilytica TaxID=2608402 RepID=UPI001F2AAC29|nr:primosomal protein [Cellulomonas palmilytica]UJP38900.1 primosomal protein [Cellulomonas palmilytica]
MTVDPRAALDRFIAALEAHYNAVVARKGEDDPAVDDAYDVLADAFEVYDDALGTIHGEATPFYLAEEEDDEDEYEDDVDDADDADDDTDGDFDDEYDDEIEVEPAR